MAVDSTPERLLPRWAQVLAALAHQVIALPVDKNKKFRTDENLKKVMVLVKINCYLFVF